MENRVVIVSLAMRARAAFASGCQRLSPKSRSWVAPADQQQFVVGLENGPGAIGFEPLGTAHDPQAAEIGVHIQFEPVQSLAVQFVRHAQIDDVIAVTQTQVVPQQRVVQHLRNVLAHVLFGMNHTVGPELGQDAVVRTAQRLDPDCLHPQQFDVHRAQYAGLEILAH
ncbi:MAG: hypothetical protein U5K56_07675 [Halioglobus sp.]|nr:hypothetical protein [Halioglobus sp.]